MDPASSRHDDRETAGDRTRLLSIGVLAVFGACALFAPLRLVTQLHEGRLTPWWANAVGAVAMALTYVWFRRAPERRHGVAAHLVAGTATVALLVPVAYGMSSSVWWLSLVAFATAVLGRPSEKRLWGPLVITLVAGATVLEPRIQVPGAGPEPLGEMLAARVAFVGILIAIAVAFRREANRRAAELAAVAAELRRANDVKARFLAHMSHELRTPLHGVIASASMALEEPMSPAVRQHVEVAHQSARSLLSLLNNLLDFTRAEADAIEVRRVRFDLHASLTETLAPLAVQARRRGLHFTATAAPNVAAPRLGDPARVAQVVLNLAQNAVKFTRVGSVAVHLEQDPTNPGVVTISVADTGPGIAHDRVTAVFEPFTQLSPGATSRTEGVGLGLSIVREVLRLMNGKIDVDSEPGEGTTFVVTLPLVVADAAPGPTNLCPRPRLATHPSPVPPSAAARTLRVLVAEDHPINQQVVARMLQRDGHTVHISDDGEDAWAALAEQPFDLLVTDVEMPRLDGVGLTERIRARERDERLARLPIIAITAHVGTDERHRLLEVGVDEHLPKPCTPASLSEAVRRLTGTRRERASRGRTTPRDELPAPPPAAEPASAEAAEEAAWEALFALEGLEGARAAQARMELDRATYRSVLVEFAARQANAVGDTRAALAGGDRATARRAAHTLKGLAAMVGAPGLETAARALELAIGRGEPEAALEPLLADVDALLAGLVARLRAAPALQST